MKIDLSSIGKGVWHVGWRDAVALAPRRTYKRWANQVKYNNGYETGKQMLRYSLAQKLGDIYSGGSK